MNISRLGHLVDPLKDMLERYEWVIGRYRESHGGPVAAFSCDFLPVEFVAAAGGLALSLPPSFRSGGCVSVSPGTLAVFDAVVWPRNCCGSVESPGVPVLSFAVPGGYGQAHADALAESVEDLLGGLGLPGPGEISRESLLEAMETYNALRRLVRGILSVRTMKRDLLSQEDLYAVMAAASGLPPTDVIGPLAAILARLNAEESRAEGTPVPAVVHSCMVDSPAVLDDMEEGGCLVVEDDTCNGRRQFDLSFGPDSPDPAAEILNAYSFKPLCPSLRGPEERYELFYRLLKSYGIELVIFLESAACPSRAGEVDVLRKRLMRLGVDPLAVRRENAREEVARYIGRTGR